ncbi:Rossmann-fold NAD(P)-binding domain-containing protein [Flindersiella endophytica]
MTEAQHTSVLITGANKGLGFETARRLGELGWTVFLGSRDQGRGRAAADKLAADGVNVVLVPLDVTSDASVADAVRLVREHTDRLDVLVNNAGGSFGVVTDPAQAVSKLHELAYSSSKAALNMLTVRYAQALPNIKFNAITPGEVVNHKFTATDMNNHTGQLTVAEGTDPIIELATIGTDGPTGIFIDRLGPVAW